MPSPVLREARRVRPRHRGGTRGISALTGCSSWHGHATPEHCAPDPLSEREEIMTSLTRRMLLAGSALAAAAGTLPRQAAAKAPAAGKQSAGVYRYKVGDYEMTALYDGMILRPIDEKFV